MGKTIKHIFLLLIISAFKAGYAQNYLDIIGTLEAEGRNEGKVKIIQSESVNTVLMLHLKEQNKLFQTNGYRICIFADTGQEANKNAEVVRSRFISMHRNAQSYKIFKYPYYRVYVGDFRTKSEALKFLKVLERDFPDAYIVPDIIVSNNY